MSNPSSIDWDVIAELSFALVDVDGVEAAVAEVEAAQQTRDLITAVVLEECQ